MENSRQPTPIDVRVGSRIRIRRKLLNLSQQNLADELGITFQQIQKYERGYNRVSASRLYDIAKILGVPTDYFFVELEESETAQAPPESSKPH